MTRWSKRPRYSPIGIDACGRDVALVQLAERPDGWHVVAAARVRRTANEQGLDATTVSRMRDVMLRQGFRGNCVAATVPSLRLHADLLELPARSPGVPIDDLARAEMGRLARLDGEPFQLATWDVPTPPRGAAGTLMMAIAGRDTETAAVLDPLIAGGLRVTSVLPDTIAATAIAIADQSREPTAVIDLDWSSASVVLLMDGRPVYQRTLGECEFGRLLRLVAVELQLEEPEALCVLRERLDDASPMQRPAGVERLLNAYLESIATELEFSLAFAAHRYPDRPINRLQLVGQGASIGGIEQWLTERFSGAETSVVRPETRVRYVGSFTELMSDPAMSRAAGLAMAGAMSSTLR